MAHIECIKISLVVGPENLKIFKYEECRTQSPGRCHQVNFFRQTLSAKLSVERTGDTQINPFLDGSRVWQPLKRAIEIVRQPHFVAPGLALLPAVLGKEVGR